MAGELELVAIPLTPRGHGLNVTACAGKRHLREELLGVRGRRALIPTGDVSTTSVVVSERVGHRVIGLRVTAE